MALRRSSLSSQPPQGARPLLSSAAAENKESQLRQLLSTCIDNPDASQNLTISERLAVRSLLRIDRAPDVHPYYDPTIRRIAAGTLAIGNSSQSALRRSARRLAQEICESAPLTGSMGSTGSTASAGSTLMSAAEHAAAISQEILGPGTNVSITFNSPAPASGRLGRSGRSGPSARSARSARPAQLRPRNTDRSGPRQQPARASRASRGSRASRQSEAVLPQERSRRTSRATSSRPAAAIVRPRRNDNSRVASRRFLQEQASAIAADSASDSDSEDGDEDYLDDFLSDHDEIYDNLGGRPGETSEESESESVSLSEEDLEDSEDLADPEDALQAPADDAPEEAWDAYQAAVAAAQDLRRAGYTAYVRRARSGNSARARGAAALRALDSIEPVEYEPISYEDSLALEHEEQRAQQGDRHADLLRLITGGFGQRPAHRLGPQMQVLWPGAAGMIGAPEPVSREERSRRRERARVERPDSSVVKNTMPSLICSITHEIFRDPVIAADGHTYEREAIEQWFASKQTSPCTGQELPHAHLIDNVAMRKSVDEYLATVANK